MKQLITAIAATLFAAGVSASDDLDFHHGWDSPDLSPAWPQHISGAVTGIQPGIGDSLDMHHGWGDGNPDLSPPPVSGVSDSGDAPDIYNLFRGNSDLSY